MQKSEDSSNKSSKERYSKFVGKKVLFLAVIGVILVSLIGLSLSIGSSKIGFIDSFKIIYQVLTGQSSQIENSARTIIWNIRLPRVLTACVAGLALGLAGAIYQGVLKNPLASPYTLGISSAAGFGAALAIVLGAGVVNYGGFEVADPVLIATNAFFFALICTGIVAGIGRIRKASPGTMILGGVAMMFIFSASISLLQYFAASEEVAAVVYWMFGSLSKATWTKLGVMSLVTLPVIPFFIYRSWDLDILMQGESTAKSLGINTKSLRIMSLVFASLITAVAVAFLGTIGFVGLVTPHLIRMSIGGDHRYLIPGSCLVGAALLLTADTVARNVIAPVVLPVGILTSYLGVPLFIYLILRKGREYW